MNPNSMNNKTKNVNFNDFSAIALKLASPDRIREWSHGEVTKPETINYRTQRSEKSGLFDEKIFGPERDFECYCGKYRGIRYKGIVCEKCGVEVTRSIVRRERMGHIELATPVSHIWFLRSMPSRIGLVLGMPTGELERVIYFAGYIVTGVSEDERTALLKDLDSEYRSKIKTLQETKAVEALKEMHLTAKREIEGVQMGMVLDEVAYHNYSVKYGTLFEARIGAEAIYEILKKTDLVKLEKELAVDLEKASAADREKVQKRLSLVRSMIAENIRPEWMFLTVIPVIPPALRPMVPLDGGRYATSDVNDLYRRVINRNNRLRKLKDINAPDVILRNEKRILQEAVDSLIDNTIRHGSASGGALNQAQRRPLKSLSDNLKGKRGLFRANLLGKRVDYSGRSVIVVGPELKLHQCGLPKHMALELFRPFVISQLLKKELAYNIRGANRLIEEDVPEVWAILEEVIKDKYVLLNRAPTLHRLGIQAFQPILIEGNAIQVHPLVCTAFNADFDGDQMAVHVPLSHQAQTEAREIMAANKNVLKPGSGEPIVSARQDIVLGCYWMTKDVVGEKGEGKVFSSPEEAITAISFNAIGYRAKIKVMAPEGVEKYKEFAGKVFETTVGRILFNQVLPEKYPFLNKEILRKHMNIIVDDLIEHYGIDNVAPTLDRIKEFGFKSATISGVTFSYTDVHAPEEKPKIIAEAKAKIDELENSFEMGFLSKEEKVAKAIEVWYKAKGDVEKAIPHTLDRNGSIYDLVFSGARGTIAQVTQMAGMKGLIVNSAGETIEFPILSSSKEGLTPIEYFITTHGSRKGLTDTALNTAKAGYLTRRLFDVAQDEVITEDDCSSKEGVLITKETASGMDVSITRNVKGRVVAADVANKDGKVLFKRGHLLNKEDGIVLEKAGISEVLVRSPLTCKTLHGICQKCYGHDLGRGALVELGEAIGTVAAQAIGEPGTQLTMRTFHAGGAATASGDITAGLPRVEEIFEKRAPKNPAAVCRADGVVTEIRHTGKEKIIVVLPEIGEKKATAKKAESEYEVSARRTPFVKVGDKVVKGQLLTDGSANIDELFKFGGREAAQNYIIREVLKIYELQGEPVSRKHIEVIIRQMFARRKVKSSGDTNLTEGDVASYDQVVEENRRVETENKEEAKTEPVVMGITEISLSRPSFLSAASFQHTTRVLINAAIRGYEDNLRGLKENVIIGRLIPAGSGFPGSPKEKMVKDAAPVQPEAPVAVEGAELIPKILEA